MQLSIDDLIDAMVELGIAKILIVQDSVVIEMEDGPTFTKDTKNEP